MAVAQPDFLLVFNESSGASVNNYGTAGGTYAVDAQAAETTDYTRTSSGGSYGSLNGYLTSLTDSGADQVWLSTSATAPGAALETINFMIAFRLTGYTQNNSRLIGPNLDATDGGVSIFIVNPSGGGDYDLDAQFKAGNTVSMTTITGLTFGTDYILSGSIDVSTPTACQARFKLGANAVNSPATVSMNTFTFENAWPYLLRRSDFTNYFGIRGRLNAFAWQRGGTAWSSTDLGDVNSNPSGNIAGWPSGGISLSWIKA